MEEFAVLKRFLIIQAVVLLLSGSATIVKGQTYELRGSLRGWLQAFTHSPNSIDISQSRLKLDLLSTLRRNSAFFMQSYFTHDARSGVSEWDLKQAYIDCYTGWMQLRFGRQIMAWGKADELNPTDILNPQNLSNILEDKMVRKIGLFAVKVNWLFYGFQLETVWKPEFKPMQLPEPDSRWGFFSLPGVTTLPPPVLPGDDLDKTEWALKLSRTVSMFDLAISWFDGWDNIFTPVFVPDTAAGGLRLDRLIFHRTRMLGAEFAGSVGSVGIWGEGAYFLTEDHRGNDPEVKNPYVQFVIGADYTFSGSVKLNVQYLKEILTKIDDAAERNAEEKMISKLGVGMPLRQALTARVEKRFGSGEAQAVEVFIIYDLDEKGYLLGPRLILSPEDAVKFEICAAVFGGDCGSLFGNFTKNDALYVKCTYSF